MDIAFAVLLVGLHLLAVNVAMAGPLVCVALEWSGARRGDELFDRAARALARASTWALTVGILLGGLLLLVRWLGDSAYMAAVNDLPRSRLWFAGAELLFYFACLGAYTGMWARLRRRRWLHRLLAIAASTNLLVHFPALFVIISVLAVRGNVVSRPLNSAGFRALLVDSEVLSRTAHIVVGSFAVTGGVVLLLSVRYAADAARRSSAIRLGQFGAALALLATVAQLPFGMWLAMSLPEYSRGRILGGDTVATSLFVLAVLAALGSMHYLSAIAMGEWSEQRIKRAVGVLLAVILLMVATRYRADERQPGKVVDARGSGRLQLLSHPLQ